MQGAIKNGGCLVAARTGQLAAVAKVLGAINKKMSKSDTARAPVLPVIVCDEADTMIGPGLAANDRRRTRTFNYEVCKLTIVDDVDVEIYGRCIEVAPPGWPLYRVCNWLSAHSAHTVTLQQSCAGLASMRRY